MGVGPNPCGTGLDGRFLLYLRREQTLYPRAIPEIALDDHPVILQHAENLCGFYSDADLEEEKRTSA